MRLQAHHVSLKPPDLPSTRKDSHCARFGCDDWNENTVSRRASLTRDAGIARGAGRVNEVEVRGPLCSGERLAGS